MTRKIKLTAMAVLVSAMLPVTAVCSYAGGEPTFKVGEVTIENGGIVDIPIDISENPGIIGATISVSYDSRLSLKGVTKGDGLSSLAMTKPANFAANPINIIWDGMDGDTTNGTMALLTFEVPDVAGEYNVSVTYSKNGTLDDNFNPVEFNIEQGGITVQPKAKSIIAQNLGVFTADNGYEGDAVSATAFRADLSGVNGTVSITITPDEGEAHTFTSVTTITDSDVVLGIIVSGLADENATSEVTIN